MGSLKSFVPENFHVKFTFQNIAMAVLGYLLLCRVLRYSRQWYLWSKYPYKGRSSFAKMTTTHAFEIQKRIFQYEFPFMAAQSLGFALFRTYGIPTISKLLVQTRQLSDKRYAPKRYVDTTVLIGEFMAHEPEHPRAIEAISRMNYIHSVYQKQGLISNDDMLYTLSLFALEPVRWVKRYEWREMTPMEVCAIGTFWKSIGDAQGISFEDFPSSQFGWRDGLHWFEELDRWSTAYEERAMVPSQYNHETANETVNILIYDLPASWFEFGRKLTSTLMDDRLRKAMMYEAPPSWLQSTVNWIFMIRKMLLKYAFLPRPSFLAPRYLSKEADKSGRYHTLLFETEPWYLENTWWNRNSLQVWIKWLTGRPVPNGRDYAPDGYLISEIGPRSLAGKGQKEFEATKAKLSGTGRGGCPFAAFK